MEENKNLSTENALELEEKSTFDFQTIYTTLILNWKWFVLSLIICLGLAAIYLRYKTPVYQAYAKILIKDEDNSSRGRNSIMNAATLGTITNSAGIDNEMEILKSRSIAEQAVRDLKLYTTYRTQGRVKETLLYKNQPITEDKLRKLQVKAVIKALDLGIFDFAETPTIQEVEEVSHELKTKYLPFNFVMTDEFKTRYSKFRQFTEKRGPFFMFNYEIYGQYVVENSKKISVKQIHAISELDLKLRLIRQAMVKTDDHYFAIVKEMMDLFKMKWFKEVRTDQKYDEDWFESFLNRFLDSDEGRAFVKLWKYERKRFKLKAVFIGCLKAAGVIEDSNANLGRNIMRADKNTNKKFGTYMSEWADYPFSTWIIDDVKG